MRSQPVTATRFLPHPRPPLSAAPPPNHSTTEGSIRSETDPPTCAFYAVPTPVELKMVSRSPADGDSQHENGQRESIFPNSFVHKMLRDEEQNPILLSTLAKQT